MSIFYNIKRCRFLLLITISISLFFYLIYPITSYASDENYQYITDKDGNEIAVLQVILNTGTIYLYGRHARSTSTINYHTYGYNFTLVDSNENPRSLGSSSYFYIERAESDEGGKSPYKPNPNYVDDQYKLDGYSIIQGMVELMRNQKNSTGQKVYKNIMEINAALGRGVTVYMSNAFKVIKRDSVGSDNFTPYGKLCHSYNDIIQEVRNQFGVDWSGATQDILHYYYDNPITIKLNPFHFNVAYIDEEDYKNGNIDDNSILAIAAENQETHCGSNSEFVLKDPDNIDINGTSYQYAGESYYKYKNKDGFYDTTSNKGVISVIHQFQRDATLYVLVKSKGDNDVIVKYVDRDGNVLKDNINGGKLTLGQYYTFNMESPFEKAGMVYKYTGDYSYTFHSKASNKEKKVSKSGTPPRFRLNDVKKDTKIYLTLVYEEGPPEQNTQINIKYFEPSPTAHILADNMGNEIFDVSSGIPTTESLYGTVTASEYLLETNFSKKEKTVTLPIKVSKTYVLEWEEPVEDTIGKDGKPIKHDPIPKSETVRAEKTVYLDRSYSYTEINDFSYYKIKDATLVNDALPNETITILPSGYRVPVLNYNHYESAEDISDNEHLVEPSQVKRGITLEEEVITGVDNKPTVPNEDFTSIVDGMVDEIKVRNDYLEFDGKLILDNSYKDCIAEEIKKTELKAPKITDKQILYKNNNVIEAIKANGNYTSTGKIVYEQINSFHSTKNHILSYDISNINSVMIHTPVYCKATIINDNSQYVQLINPNMECEPIVLDEAGISSDFIIHISNTGFHSGKQGYGSRDYSINTKSSASYVAKKDGVLRNEVKFPFPVYQDIGNDRNTVNDNFIVKDTWVTIGNQENRFYVPAFVEEGIYTVEFRTIAVNGWNRLNNTERNTNTFYSNYVATDQKKVQISGRVYGLTIYDIQDYPLWQEVFRKSNSSALKINAVGEDGTILGLNYNKDYQYNYTAGTKDQYGNEIRRSRRFTFPLIAGSHAKYRNQGALKAGYNWRFTLDTMGSVTKEDGSYIKIHPRFYYVNNRGLGREEVDLYYSEQVNSKKGYLIKVGSEIDKNNIKSETVGNVFLGIPKSELLSTAALRGIKYSTWISQRANTYFYGGLISNNAFKTFTAGDYANLLLNSSNANTIKNIGISEEEITKRKQSYYFTYSIPSSVKAVTNDFDVKKYAQMYGVNYLENFWKREGYLIMNIETTVYDKDGNPYLSYINEGNRARYNHCCMWSMEGGGIPKTDFYGTTFDFQIGDFIMFFTDKTSREDYTVGGIY